MATDVAAVIDRLRQRVVSPDGRASLAVTFSALALVAAKVGTTRLIDNIPLTFGAAS